MQHSIYYRLISPKVRDLYWLLFFESPLHPSYDLSPYALFPQTVLNEWEALSTEYFLELDKNPQSINQFVDRKKNKRLGFYAEALLSFFFQTFRETELLLQNFQIIDAQKTIGEVDFIIEYKGKVMHIECAVKYYLLKDRQQQNDASKWVGPRLKDNLGLKLNRLIYHQLPLGKREEIQQKIQGTVNASYLFLKGLFFTETKIEENLITNGNTFQFIRQPAVQKLRTQAIEILPKPNWLSATKPKKNNGYFHTITFNEPLVQPELVLFDDNNVRFVVPKDWGKTP